MADKRKLQGEIDRCHKKVGEGVESFKETWKKLQQATNPNQKEKYEQDLKKEIKKLQRLRDQIKTWCASNEVKDKRILLEDRKLIETQMETFKVLERETKTKAYSKEALGLPAKIDPAEKERCEMREWLNDIIDQLNVEIDKVECDIETIKAQNKKGKSKDKSNDALQEFEGYLKKHRWHIANLEALLRMLDNNTLNISELKSITEEIEYYVTDHKEPDFVDNEYIYSDIVDSDVVANSTLDAKLSGMNHSDNDDTDSNMEDVSAYGSTYHDSHHDHVPMSPSSKSSSTKSKSSTNSNSTSTNHTSNSRSRNPTPNNGNSTSGGVTSTNNPNYAKVPSGGVTRGPIVAASGVAGPGVTTVAPPSQPSQPPGGNNNNTTASTTAISPPGIIPLTSHQPTPPSTLTHSLYTTLPTDHIRSPPISTTADITSPAPIPGVGLTPRPTVIDEEESFVLDPNLGVSPLGPSVLTPERIRQMEIVEAAAENMPLPTDTSRVRPMNWIYAIPDVPQQIPEHHHHSYDPKLGFDTFEYFKSLAPDTLFFIFYFYEGTRAQLFAAKALKEQHWRFHKKFKMWFQRYEEPKEITKTHETGTYVYFDFNEWQQRTKEDFTFEYKYLEENSLDD